MGNSSEEPECEDPLMVINPKIPSMNDIAIRMGDNQYRQFLTTKMFSPHPISNNTKWSFQSQHENSQLVSLSEILTIFNQGTQTLGNFYFKFCRSEIREQVAEEQKRQFVFEQPLVKTKSDMPKLKQELNSDMSASLLNHFIEYFEFRLKKTSVLVGDKKQEVILMGV